MRGGILIVGLVLICAAPLAFGQATRPAESDAYQNMPIPARRGATTQGTGIVAPGAGADIFETKRMAMALGIVLLAIFVAHRVWKRLGLPGVSGRLSGVLQVVSRLSVSPKQQILLVRVGRRLVLVGNSGTQMNPLCEIGDPEEAASLLGEVATHREESASASFNAVLGGEEKRFEEETIAAVTSDESTLETEDDSAIAGTRAELSGLAEKVRSLSNQFRRV